MRAKAKSEMMEAAMATARRGEGGLSSRAVIRTAARACDAVTMVIARVCGCVCVWLWVWKWCIQEVGN